jgi:hypothetical protein
MGDANSNGKKTGLKPIQAKGVIKFLCLFVLVYGLAMAPWPGLANAYARLYRAGAACLFKSFGSKGITLFFQSKDNEQEIKMFFYRRDRRGPDGLPVLLARLAHDTRGHGYMPTVFLIALILATPLGWKPRGWALFWAMIIIHLVIVLRLWIWVLYGFGDQRLSLLVLSPFWKRLLVFTVDFFLENLSFRLIVSVFIWILVCFGREHWRGILGPKKQAPRNKQNAAIRSRHKQPRPAHA